MIAAEGYVPLSSLARMRENALPFTRDIRRGMMGYMVGKGPSWQAYFYFMGSEYDLADHAFLTALHRHLYVCGPQGQVLRIDPRALRTDHAEQECRLDDALLSGPISKEYYWAYDLAEIEPAQIPAAFEALPEWQSTNMHDWMRETHVSGHLTLPWWYERVGWTICMDVYDAFSRSPDVVDYAPFYHVAKALRPFSGWSLCTTVEFAEDGLLRAIVEAAKLGPSHEEASGGRPPVAVNETARAYSALFPSGHGRTPLKVVLNRVNEQTGLDVSRRTLERAIKGANSPVSEGQN
ncbi:hypothetical protein GI374_05420 [Paracoccus sp. S-4012]|uniref:hypothetical protein n=1 Tax=Paracoccus sp. S-4012 TaxID=2665648 RepID=UPI0012AF205F|nr:hypothetical protein [Paracoccus sp. S-4012]MRX49900.1 hypothetical protein [Paracoccus sp. S-4012]